MGLFLSLVTPVHRSCLRTSESLNLMWIYFPTWRTKWCRKWWKKHEETLPIITLSNANPHGTTNTSGSPQVGQKTIPLTLSEVDLFKYSKMALLHMSLQTNSLNPIKKHAIYLQRQWLVHITFGLRPFSPLCMVFILVASCQLSLKNCNIEVLNAHKSHVICHKIFKDSHEGQRIDNVNTSA
jgi:hypothetical protein